MPQVLEIVAVKASASPRLALVGDEWDMVRTNASSGGDADAVTASRAVIAALTMAL